MALTTFVPPCNPSPGLVDTPELKIITAEFGDGATQSSPEGLNHIRRVLAAQWPILDKIEAAAMIAFFRARKGVEAFLCKFPDDAAAGKWTVAEWTDTIGQAGYHAVTATFRQSFRIDA